MKQKEKQDKTGLQVNCNQVEKLNEFLICVGILMNNAVFSGVVISFNEVFFFFFFLNLLQFQYPNLLLLLINQP